MLAGTYQRPPPSQPRRTDPRRIAYPPTPATRNVRRFEGARVNLVNPWEAAAGP